MVKDKEKNKRILLQWLVILLAAFAVLLLVWFLEVSRVKVRNQWTLDAGTDMTFTAEDSVICGMTLSYDAVNREVYGRYDPQTFSGTIQLYQLGREEEKTIETTEGQRGEAGEALEESKETEGAKLIWEETFHNAPVNILSVSSSADLAEFPDNGGITLKPGSRYRVRIVSFSAQEDSAEEIHSEETEEEQTDTSYSISLFGSERNFAGLYWILSAGILLILSSFYFLYYGFIALSSGTGLSSRPSGVRLPFGLMWIPGILFVSVLESLAMLPPCVPDGELHFYSSYAMSNQIMQSIPFLRDLAGEVPVGILRMHSFGDPQYVWHFWNDWESGNLLVPRADSFFLVGMMPHYPYVIPALGLTLMRAFRAPWQLMLLGGQMMNVLLYAVITLLAIYAKPEWKRAIIAITFLPSTLWIVNSYSYDVWNLAFLLLAVAWCGKLAGQEKVSVAELLFAALLMIAFIPVKFIYFNFALCLFFVTAGQWKVRHKKLFVGGMIAVIGLGIAVVFAARGQEILTFLGAGGFDLRSDNTVDSTYTLGWAVRNPVRMILLYLKSFYDSGPTLFLNTFLGDNFQGDIPGILAIPVVGCFFIVMSGLAGTTAPGRSQKKRARILLRVILITGILIVMTSFVFVYSTKPAAGLGTITGMQGRYFIPYLICVPAFLRPHAWAKRNGRTAEYLMASLTMISILTRFTGVLTG